MFRTLQISASGLIAQRTRMDTIAGNIAHANTTVNEHGEVSPFQRRLVVLEAVPQGEHGASSGSERAGGVRATVEIDKTTPPREISMPGHPQADANGMVKLPNIDPVTEFVNAIEASRAYEANVNTMQITRDMIDGTFRIIG